MNKVLGLTGYHHVGIMASDMQKSIEFYEKLGFTKYLGWDNPNGRIQLMDIGNGEFIELFSWGTTEDQVNQRLVHLAFEVEDVEKAYNTALEVGARSKMAPKVVELDADPRKGKICCAFVFGPNNEELEFFKEYK